MRILLVLTAIFVVASVSCTSTDMLDTDKLEGVLKTQIEEQTDATVESIDCPSDVEIEKGGTLECTGVDGSGTTFTVEVTQTDDTGNVHWEVAGGSA